MKGKLKNFHKMFVIAAAYVSYTVGAGFASGNEVLQFFGSWGFPQSFQAVLGAVIVTAIYNICLFRAGQSIDFKRTTDSYNYFGGKVLGCFFQIFIFAFVFSCFMLMFSGAGSLLNQQWGVPQWIGALAMGIVAAIIILGGIKAVENVLGFIGTFIMFYLFTFGIISLFHSGSSLDQAVGAAQAVSEGKIWQANLFELPPLGWIPGLAGLNSPFITGVLYGALCIVSGFPFYLTLGRQTKSIREATKAGIFTTIIFYLCVGCVLLIVLSNFNALTDPETGKMFPFPTLAAVDAMWPGGSWTFVILVYCEIFTTVLGYMWVISDWFYPGQEKSKKNIILIVVLMVMGVTLGGVIPFSMLINFMFPLTGIVGLIMTATVLVKTMKAK